MPKWQVLRLTHICSGHDSAASLHERNNSGRATQRHWHSTGKYIYKKWLDLLDTKSTSQFDVLIDAEFNGLHLTLEQSCEELQTVTKMTRCTSR